MAMMRDSIETVPLPLLILAGGFGTRLRSVLGNAPKALAPVNGKPFLYLQIQHWLNQGITSFFFLLHYQADQIIDFLKSEEKGLLKNCQVQYIVEAEPMGTGGAVSYALGQIALECDFLLTNADTWLGTGIQEMMRGRSPAILAVQVNNVGRYGEIRFDQNMLVTAFMEKKAYKGAGWINGGLCRMHSNLFRKWDQQPFSLESVILPKLVEQKLLSAVPIHSTFIDIGIPEDYERFCHWIHSEQIESL